jgi:3-oxoacyl-[acyl-carrier-protein] synthase III
VEDGARDRPNRDSAAHEVSVVASELDHGRWPAFAPSFFPQLDVSAAASVEDLETVIERDFAAKAPTAADIADRCAGGDYASRFELLRDAARYLYWAHRYFLTLHTLRPCRWEDVPTDDPDARLPLVVALDVARGTADLVGAAFARLPPGWPGSGEQTVLELLAEPLACVGYDAARLTAVLPTVEVAVGDPGSVVMRVRGPRPVCVQARRRDVLGRRDRVPQLTALLRQAGAIACEHAGRWGRPALTGIAELRASDFVLLAWPRSAEVSQLLSHRVPGNTAAAARPRPLRTMAGTARLRYTPSRGVTIAGLAAVKGELRATNDDIVANAAWNWSPMSSADIAKRTGILERRYTDRTLDDIASDAALQVLADADDIAAQVGAVVSCSASNAQPIPSLAARIADRAGLTELAGVWDVVAACAGLPYGLGQAARIVEEAHCAVLLVLAEKFSDKVGTIRSSRMLFGDGAAAVLLAPASDGDGDVHLVQTYAGGSCTEVNAVLWPNAAFNNHLTVDGDGARTIVQRYMRQILDDLAAATTRRASPLDGIDLIVPHQANEPMVRAIALAAGVPGERLYFNVARMGNIGGASIPIALHDAILDGTITDETRVLAPAFAAGALAGFTLLTVRPRVLGANVRTTAVDTFDRVASARRRGGSIAGR